MRNFSAIHLILIVGMVIGLCSCGPDPEERGIEGKVVDENNKGLQATVLISGPESQSKATESDGSFTFEDIEAGTYEIGAEKEDYEYLSGAKEVTVPDDGFARADITLAKENSQTIGGVVQDATTGEPIANVQLTTNPITDSITSDDNGSYRFGEKQKLKPGSYTVSAKADGYEDAKVTITVVLGEPARADISMTPLEPRIRLTPKDRLDFGGSSISKILTIANVGTGKLVWQISAPTEGWLNLSRRQGNTGDTPSTVDVTVDREPIKDKPGTYQMELRGDVNGSGKVDIFDLVLVGSQFGQVGDNLSGDVDSNGKVDIFDLVMVGSHFGESVNAAPSSPQDLSTQKIRDLIHALEGSPSVSLGEGAEVALRLLHELLADVNSRPDQTRLLPNYPNPFNPETWIPFELAENASVRSRFTMLMVNWLGG